MRVQSIETSRDPHLAFRRSVHCPAVLASEVCYTGRTVDQKRLAPDSFNTLFPQHFQ